MTAAPNGTRNDAAASAEVGLSSRERSGPPRGRRKRPTSRPWCSGPEPPDKERGLPPLPEEPVVDPAVKTAAAEEVVDAAAQGGRQSPRAGPRAGLSPGAVHRRPGIPSDPRRSSAGPAGRRAGPARGRAPARLRARASTRRRRRRRPADRPAPTGRAPRRQRPGDRSRAAPGRAGQSAADARRRRTPPSAPIRAGTHRITAIYGGPKFAPRQYQASDGTKITVITGGVNIVTNDPKQGTIDVESDSAIIWNKPKPGSPRQRVGPERRAHPGARRPDGGLPRGARHRPPGPAEAAGLGRPDGLSRHARPTIDYIADRFIALDAEVNLFAPGPDRADQDQHAADRPVPPAGRRARRADDAPVAFEADPRAAVGLDRQPVRQAGLSVHQPVDRPEEGPQRQRPARPGRRRPRRRPAHRPGGSTPRQNFFFMGPVPGLLLAAVTSPTPTTSTRRSG